MKETQKYALDMDGMTKNIGEDKRYMFAIQLLGQILFFLQWFSRLLRPLAGYSKIWEEDLGPLFFPAFHLNQ